MSTEKLDWIVIKSMAQLPLTMEEACCVLDTPMSEITKVSGIDQIQIVNIRNWAKLEKRRHDSALLAGTCSDNQTDTLSTKVPIRLYKLQREHLYRQIKSILKNAL